MLVFAELHAAAMLLAYAVQLVDTHPHRHKIQLDMLEAKGLRQRKLTPHIAKSLQGES